MSSKQLNSRQAKWVEFLSKFNFRIIYRFDKQSIKFDNLTKRVKDLSKNKNDDRI